MKLHTKFGGNSAKIDRDITSQLFPALSYISQRSKVEYMSIFIKPLVASSVV